MDQSQNQVQKKKIFLDDQTYDLLNQMGLELKAEEKFVRINSAKLLSWIIRRYRDSYFICDKKDLIKDHFDQKGYLKEIAEQIKDEDDLSEILKRTLDHIQRQPSQNGQRNHSKHGKGHRPKAIQEKGLSEEV